MLKKTTLIIILLTAFTSCKTIKSLSELKKENANVYSYNFSNKEIKLIPMHHLGKKEFYDDVKAKISQFKNDGYVVYYEQISSKLEVDSIQNDIIRRKVRKIKGFSGSYTDIAKGTFLEKYVKQPSYKELGIDENDKRADVDYLQFINEWEKLNGVIILDSLDLNTKFDAKYEKGTFYTNKQYEKIVIEYRNNYLLDLIKTSKKSKILVVYGEGHRKNFEKKINSKIE